MKYGFTIIGALLFLLGCSNYVFAQKKDTIFSDETFLKGVSNNFLDNVNEAIFPEGLDRALDSSKLNEDTLVFNYTIDWKKCVPQLTGRYSVIMKIQNFWEVFDYYNKGKKLFQTFYFQNAQIGETTGPYRQFFKNEQQSVYGHLTNGKKDKQWMEYDSTGHLIFQATFKNNRPAGHAFYYDTEDKDSTLFLLDSTGAGYAYIHYNNGKKVLLGKYTSGFLKDSVWSHYNKDGTIWYSQKYQAGKLVKETCYNPDGTISAKCITRNAHFGKHDNSIMAYLQKHIHFPTYEMLNVNKARIVAGFIVDTTGKVSDIKILQPVDKGFDEEVIHALKRMKGWTPAINHNRTVKEYFISPINFTYNN